MNITKQLAVTSLFCLLIVGGLASHQAEEPQAPPRHFLLLMRLGPAYDKALPIQQQKGFSAHAMYMCELESKGLLVLGGPLLEDFASMRPTGGVLVVRAESTEEARKLAAVDPSGLLEVEEVRAFLLSAGAK